MTIIGYVTWTMGQKQGLDCVGFRFRQEWKAVAALHQAQQPGHQALAWVDCSYRVRWVVLLGCNEAILGRDHIANVLYRSASVVTTRRGMVTAAHAIEWATADKGCLVCVSPVPEGNWGGYLPGVFLADRGEENVP